MLAQAARARNLEYINLEDDMSDIAATTLQKRILIDYTCEHFLNNIFDPVQILHWNNQRSRWTTHRAFYFTNLRRVVSWKIPVIVLCVIYIH